MGEQPAARGAASAVLSEVLLASSAFPAVFRPRLSWEVMADEARPVQLIDGGVMDNLPLHAVTQFLERTASCEILMAAPDVPHLMIAASLEVESPDYHLAFTRRRLAGSWLALRRRTAQLSYNRKLEGFRSAQDMLRQLSLRARTEHIERLKFTPVHVKVLAIKPHWLCSTFGFHPMMGFQRKRQAQSIAHGCAGTLLALAKLREELKHSTDPHDAPMRARGFDEWGIDATKIPPEADWVNAFDRWERIKKGAVPGSCWLRDVRCPFSRPALESLNSELRDRPEAQRIEPGELSAIRVAQRIASPLSETKVRELTEIHRLCCQRKTHLRKI